MIVKRFLVSILAFAIPFMLFAQQSMDNTVDMADTMRSNGKIYVVVTVVTIIMTGLIVYLLVLDRKISNLEKKIDSKNQS